MGGVRLCLRKFINFLTFAILDMISALIFLEGHFHWKLIPFSEFFFLNVASRDILKRV